MINGCFDTPPVGDGIGFDGTNVCTIDSTTVANTGECFDTPPLGDGIGFNGVEECRIEATDDNVSVASSGMCFDSPPLGNGCLLYTSPSPRDQRGSRMPSSA